MANKYIERNASTGVLTQVEGLVTSSGSGDAGRLVAVGSDGRFSVTVMPVGVGPDTSSLVTSEDLSAGDYINIYNDGGTPTARLADAGNGRPAHGYVKAATTSPAACVAYFEGANSDLSGLTPGGRVYLDTVGGVTQTPRTTGLHQFLGLAISATEVNTDIDDQIVL